ncbi:hypothetical protein GOODEAATRI_032679, partial [Goodea atripinnis]
GGVSSLLHQDYTPGYPWLPFFFLFKWQSETRRSLFCRESPYRSCLQPNRSEYTFWGNLAPVHLPVHYPTSHAQRHPDSKRTKREQKINSVSPPRSLAGLCHCGKTYLSQANSPSLQHEDPDSNADPAR